MFAKGITPARVMAVLLGICGVAVLGSMAACFVVTVCYAFSSFLTLKLAGANAPVDMRAAVFISQLGALLVLLPALIVSLVLQPQALSQMQAAPPPAWGNVALLGLFSTALAYVLYFRLIADEGPQKALTVTFIVPVFAVLWGWLLMGEPLSLGHVAGGGLIALSLWLVLHPAAKK